MTSFTGSLTFNTQGSVDTTKFTTVVQTKAERPELSLPLASIGAIVPWVIGRYRITTPNFLWYGNVKNIVKTTKKEQTETKVKDVEVRSIFWNGVDPLPPDALPSDSDLAEIARESLDDPMFLTSVKVYETETIVTYVREVVGYTVDVAIGICLGPDVELLGIYRGNEQIWSGRLVGRAEIPGNGNEESILQNGAIYHGGQFDQAPEPYLSGIPGGPATGGNLPGYVGTAYIVLKTVNAALLSGADLQFEVRRLPNPLGLPDDVNVIAGDDINPATAVADRLLNDWGGVGIDPAWIDVDNFIDAAERYADEGLGMSMAVAQESYGVTLIREMQEQTRSLIYADPTTSLIRIKPIRPDTYDENALLEITPKIGSSFQKLTKPAFLAMPTHFAIKYYNRAQNYEATTVTNRNPGVPPLETRGKRLAGIEFGACCTATIAEASFDLIMSSIAVPLLEMTLVTDRNAADLVPGDLFLISWPLYEMVKFPAYVTKIREQELMSNSVLIECEQYLRPNVKKFFKAPEPTRHVAPDMTARKPIDAMITDAPWWILQRMGHNGNPDTPLDVTYPLFLVAGANDNQLYFDVYNRDNDAALLEAEAYPLNGKLVGSVSKLDAHETWILDELTIGQVVNPDYLANIGAGGVSEGTRLLFINDEIMSFEGFTQNNDGTVTLLNVHRGLIDTIAANHSAGDTVYIVDKENMVLSDKGHKQLEDYTYGIVSRARKNIGAYPADAYNLPTYNAWRRADCPLRPHYVHINTERKPEPIDIIIGEETYINWSTRSRINKKIALFADNSERPELMSKFRQQAHVIYLIDSDDVEFNLGNTITGDEDGIYPPSIFGDEFTFNVPAGAAEGVGRIKVEASHMKYDPGAGLPPSLIGASWQTEEIAVYVRPVGWTP